MPLSVAPHGPENRRGPEPGQKVPRFREWWGFWAGFWGRLGRRKATPARPSNQPSPMKNARWKEALRQACLPRLATPSACTRPNSGPSTACLSVERGRKPGEVIPRPDGKQSPGGPTVNELVDFADASATDLAGGETSSSVSPGGAGGGTPRGGGGTQPPARLGSCSSTGPAPGPD